MENFTTLELETMKELLEYNIECMFDSVNEETTDKEIQELVNQVNLNRKICKMLNVSETKSRTYQEFVITYVD